MELGGLNGVQALARLQQVIHRIADQWRPASPVESFAIVRQRLFEEPGADAQAGSLGMEAWLQETASMILAS